jgi:hypothetical protein
MAQGTGNWIGCYWEEHSDKLGQIMPQADLVAEGILFIPPPVEDITFHDGLWDELNRALGTMFDSFEEERVQPTILREMAHIISSFSRRHYDGIGGEIYAQVGWRSTPNPGPLLAQIPAIELRKWLYELSKFLADAASQDKTVIISL